MDQRVRHYVHVNRRRSRLGRNLFALAGAKVPDALPGGDNLLHRDLQGSPLKVLVPMWTDLPPFVNDKAQLIWNGTVTGTPVAITQADIDNSSDIELSLPAASIAVEGVHQLSYRVIKWSDDPENPEEPVPGPAVTVTVDLTAPGGAEMGRIRFAEHIEEGGLTSDQLTQMGDVLPGNVPNWWQMMAGDQVLVSLDALDGTHVEVGPLEVQAGDEDKLFPVQFTRANLGKFDGYVDFTYRVTDRAGNPSGQSPATRLRLLINEAPADLLAPVIVDAMDDNLIVEAEARLRVGVEIPHYTNARAGDEILLIWGRQTAANRIAIPPGGEGEDPLLTLEAGYAMLRAEGEKYSANVIYEVYRSGTRMAASPSAPVNVDLSLAGGEDPDPETPIHENLKPPTIVGASGTPNVLTPDDLEANATATIPHLAVDDEAVFIVGDSIQLFFDDVAVGSPTVIDAVPSADVPIIVVPASMAGLSGVVQMNYEVTRKLETDPFTNTSKSPYQPVQVTSKDDLPGGGELDVGIFEEAGGANVITRSEAESNGGTPFRIPHYSNIAAGDKILFKFWGIDNGSGTGNEVPGSRYEPAEYTLREGDWDEAANRAYTFVVPTVNLLTMEHLGQGSAWGWYRITNPAGSLSPDDDTLVLIDVRPINP